MQLARIVVLREILAAGIACAGSSRRLVNIGPRFYLALTVHGGSDEAIGQTLFLCSMEVSCNAGV